MATTHVDGKEYGVSGVDNLLEACLSLGLDIPCFYWHPALGSVGACRQCTVRQYQNAEDARDRLVTSCMIPASGDTLISINDKKAKQLRESAVEWLMTNHPHDCPVCEEDGNCHLRDMTMMTEHSFRRYRFTKRTHRSQDLGPLISHEMSRYITCCRCVRYYKDYADGMDLDVYGAHDNVYSGRPKDGTLESEFSGNLVGICPTGVFTDKTRLERCNRKWDMQFAPSIYQQCSIGYNISSGEHYGELRHIRNRYNGTINHYFLCDHDRFGYGYVSLKDCPHQPAQRRGGDFITLNAEQAVQGAADILHRSKKVIDIGSPRASVESNFALCEPVDGENFYTDIAHGEQKHLQLALKVLHEGGIYTPVLREIESYGAVLVLGGDVAQTGARATLAVRQAAKDKAREMATIQKVADWQITTILNIGQRTKHPLFATNVDGTCLDDIAVWTYRTPAEDQTRLGSVIAHVLDSSAPTVGGIEPELQSKIGVVVQALAGTKRPLVISGTNAGSIKVIWAAVNVAEALKDRGADVGATMTARSINSMGLGIMSGGSLKEALTELEAGRADAVVVLESNLRRRVSATRMNAALAKAPLVMVVDRQRTVTMKNTHPVLSTASFAESDGMVINNEGRIRHFFQVYDPAYHDSKTITLEGWRWLHSLHSILLSREVDWAQLNHMIDAVVAKTPELADIKDTAPDATSRIRGQKLAHEPHRYSGYTAVRASINVHELRQPQDIDTMLIFSMEGNSQPAVHRSRVPFTWAPGWNSPQAWNRFQDEVGGKLRFGDPGMCLFETSESGLDYFTSVPACFQSRDGKWRIVPHCHLFGSDELLRRAPVFQSRMPQPYTKLNPADAVRLGVNADTHVSFSYDGSTVTLPVEIAEGLTAGQVGLSMGISGIAPILASAHLEDLREVQR